MYKLIPHYQDYLWGGTKLKTEYNKKSSLSIIAESWELSTHPAGTCYIDINHRQLPLSEYIAQHGKNVLGSKSLYPDQFPILIKLIDARKDLSIQVHPNDSYAQLHENDLGKTEMWYVLEAEPDAKLIYGFKKDLTLQDFEEAIESNTLIDYLNTVSVQPGDAFLITPGTIHAIGKGIVIAEIQQSSNVTYRVFDYGRLDANGNPRTLHIQQAKEVTNLTKTKHTYLPYTMTTYNGYSMGLLTQCDYFQVHRIDLEERITLEATDESFHSLLITSGEVEVFNDDTSLTVHKGESVFIPANTGIYYVKGTGTLLLSTI